MPRVQAAVRRPCRAEAEAHRGHDLRKLLPSGEKFHFIFLRQSSGITFLVSTNKIILSQVQQELSSTFARLCHLVDETTGEMKDDIKRIDAELAAMEENAARSKVSY